MTEMKPIKNISATPIMRIAGIVIRHAAIDAAGASAGRRKREISLEYLIEEKHYPFHTCVLLYLIGCNLPQNAV